MSTVILLCLPAAMIFNGWHSDRRGERYLHLALPLALCAFAFTVLGFTTNAALVVGAYWLDMCATSAWNPMFWLVPCETISPNAMAISVAAINSGGIAGGFVCPLLWGMARDATRSFHVGLIALSAAFLCAAALILLMRHAARQAFRFAVYLKARQPRRIDPASNQRCHSVSPGAAPPPKTVRLASQCLSPVFAIRPPKAKYRGISSLRANPSHRCAGA